MSKSKLVKVLVAGLVLGAGSVHAFPGTAHEAPAVSYADAIQTPAHVGTRSARVTFPTSVNEHGSSLEARVEARPVLGDIMRAIRAMFPASISETSL
jgi:hypothetical protein